MCMRVSVSVCTDCTTKSAATTLLIPTCTDNTSQGKAYFKKMFWLVYSLREPIDASNYHASRITPELQVYAVKS